MMGFDETGLGAAMMQSALDSRIAAVEKRQTRDVEALERKLETARRALIVAHGDFGDVARQSGYYGFPKIRTVAVTARGDIATALKEIDNA